jgi:hypothetical protein
MHLIVDEQTRTACSDCVIRFSSPADPSAEQSLRLIDESGVLDFWEDENEDGYTATDGEPLS